MEDKPRFHNRVALITGSGSDKGIGFAAADILAKGDGKIAITSTTERIYDRAKSIEATGAKVKGYIADLMDRNQVRRLVGEVITLTF